MQQFRGIKEVHTEPCGRMELPQNQNTRRELYEQSPTKHRTAQVYTKILRRGTKLLRDYPANWQECKHNLTGDTAKLYAYVRYSNLLSAHSTEEVPAAAQLLSSRDVPFPGSDRLHQ